MKYLPKNIKWVSPFSLSSSGYQEVLVAHHKHSVNDWTISFGWVHPIHDYTEYKIFIKSTGLSKEYPDTEIKLNEILAIGVFNNYGEIKGDI